MQLCKCYPFHLEMELKKLHMGTMSYGLDSMDEVATQLANALEQSTQDADSVGSPIKLLGTRGRRDLSSRVKDVVLALGLCHNVSHAVREALEACLSSITGYSGYQRRRDHHISSFFARRSCHSQVDGVCRTHSLST